MATTHSPTEPSLSTRWSFDRFAGAAAIGTALAGLGYAFAFVLLAAPLLAGLFLVLGGLLTTPVLVAVHDRVRGVDRAWAAWAVLLILAGALGSAVHGGYDLAVAVHPPSGGLADLPNPVDPRGLLTFAVSGIGLLALGALITRDRRFPRGLGHLAGLAGLLLLALYVGRLVVLDPTSPVILLPAVLVGFVVNPVLYAWLGGTLLRSRPR
jgi:hypothetical protein